MPKPYPKEFREDVVRVAGNREPGVTLEQIAADFGAHPITLSKWLRRAEHACIRCPMLHVNPKMLARLDDLRRTSSPAGTGPSGRAGPVRSKD